MLLQRSHPTPSRKPPPHSSKRTAHQWAVLRGINEGHVPIGEDEECRPRADKIWVRPGADRARKDLDGAKLWDAIAWMPVRKREEMSPQDLSTLEELKVRAWGWGEVTTRRGWYSPAWIDSMMPARRSAGFRNFLLVLLSCYRSGAVGLLLGYHECRSLCDVGSDSTWRRWCKEMEGLGLVRIVQTWTEDTGPTGRQRKYSKLLYCLGPAFHEAVGVGLLEGLTVTKNGKPNTGWPRQAAKRARNITRDARDKRRRDLWAQRNARSSPSFNSSSILKDHNPSLRSGSETSTPLPGWKRPIKVRATRAKSMASPERPKSKSTATADDPNPVRSSQHSPRIDSADDASKDKMTNTPQMKVIGAEFMAKLRAELADRARCSWLALIFFVLMTSIGCRENPYTEFGESPSSVGMHLAETSWGSSGLPPATPSGKISTSGEDSTSDSEASSTSSTGSDGESTVGGESSSIFDSSESESESTGLDTWDECVRPCAVGDGGTTFELRAWCTERFDDGPDQSDCVVMAMEAAMMRCIRDCEWCNVP